jgi:quinohemoprotein ethanol dehydrogenase
LGTVTRADHDDLKTGRPVENPNVRPPNGGAVIYPSSVGMHDWQAMSFSPEAGYAYLPLVDMSQYFSDKGTDTGAWRTQPFRYNTGYDILDVGDFSGIKLSASLVAWDPIKRQKAWEVTMPGLWNGGTLVTGGDLFFQGNASGEFAAYDARSGAKLWSLNLGLGIVGARAWRRRFC